MQHIAAIISVIAEFEQGRPSRGVTQPPYAQNADTRRRSARLLRNDGTEKVFRHVVRPITVADVFSRGLLDLTLNLNPAMRSSIKTLRSDLDTQRGDHLL